MNRTQLSGRLAKDPEVRYTQTGKAVANFSIAVSRGKDSEVVDFIDVVVWGVLAENCGNILRKGQFVYVDGRMQTRTYETNEGQKRKVVEVVANMVADPLPSFEQKEQAVGSIPAARSSFGSEVLPDEDIPF